MKNLIVLILLINLFNLCYSQNDKLVNGAYFTIGLSGNINNISNFENYLKENYNKSVTTYPLGVQIDFFAVRKKAIFGAYGERGVKKPIIICFYYGRKIFNINGFTSFLNFDIGVYTYGMIKDVVPKDYVPIEREIGKLMELEYNSWYFGLTNKIFKIRKSNSTNIKGTVFGIDLKFGYLPFGHWDYGYGENSRFKSREISGLPDVTNIFASINLYFGIH